MAERNQIYRRFSKNSWFDLGRTRVWQAADHLLLVENRFFSEYYTRLYWTDMQAILLYSLGTRSPILLGLEGVCVAALLAALLLWRLPWVFLPALLFVLAYALWRFARPHWACQIATRISTRQFALPGTLIACRRVVDGIKQNATSAQGMLPEASSEQPTAVRRLGSIPRQPVLAIHVIAFVLGILSPWSVFLFALYCATLIAAYFLQQDFRFPFAVRSAAAMSQILAVLQIAFWGFAISRESAMRPFMLPFAFEHWQFALPRIAFSLYGIAAVYWGSMQISKPQQKSSTVLGLS